MNDNSKAKKALPWLWLAVLSGLVVMEILEPLLFEGEKYDAWRVVKIVAWAGLATMYMIQWRKAIR